MTLEQFIHDSGYKVGSSKNKTLQTKLRNVGLIDIGHMIPLSMKDLASIDGVSDNVARNLYQHLQKIRGNNLMSFEELMKRSEKIEYFPTGSISLDLMMTHSNGKIGWRTSSVVELTGLPGSFKTQLCMSAAASCMSSLGLNRSVIYLDSQTDLDICRMEKLAANAGVSHETFSEKFFLANIQSLNEIDLIMNDIHSFIQKNDVGLIVIDSISKAVHNQYPISGWNLSNYFPRNDHLFRLFSALRVIANYYNLLVLYTNRMDKNMTGQLGVPEYEPFEKNLIGYYPSTIIYLSKPAGRDHEEMPIPRRDPRIINREIRPGRAIIMDSSYLPSKKGYFYVSEDGISFME